MRVLFVLLALMSLNLSANDDRVILEAIADQETGHLSNPVLAVGDRGRALGRYQMHRRAWRCAELQLMREGNQSFSRSEWRNPEAQDVTALAYIRYIRARIRALGVQPTPGRIALAWNKGVKSAHLTHWKLNAYAQRVQNLVDARKQR